MDKNALSSIHERAKFVHTHTPPRVQAKVGRQTFDAARHAASIIIYERPGGADENLTGRAGLFSFKLAEDTVLC